jgi:putative sigma-54 modulation protein
MTINIQPKSMELTDAIREYAEEKFTTLEKYIDGIEKIDIEIGMDSHHHNKGEVYVCSGHVFIRGKDFFVSKEEADLYKAVDKVKDHLREELTDYKEKHLRQNQGEV